MAKPRSNTTKSAAKASARRSAARKDLAKVEKVRSTACGTDGGETHRTTADAGDGTRLTTAHGAPIADDQNTLTAGDGGPQLLEDFVLRDKIFHFDHERIPERVVHARGFGAKGCFEPYESLSDVTAADLFQRPGERTEVFVRFSTVAGNKGSADLARDVRGFAVKLYTKRATGTWWGTTSRCSSSRTRSSFQSSSTLRNQSRTGVGRKHRRRTTTSGTSSG
jgi:hypothetical protein